MNIFSLFRPRRMNKADRAASENKAERKEVLREVQAGALNLESLVEHLKHKRTAQ